MSYKRINADEFSEKPTAACSRDYLAHLTLVKGEDAHASGIFDPKGIWPKNIPKKRITLYRDSSKDESRSMI